jgi:hypothetical protein
MARLSMKNKLTAALRFLPLARDSHKSNPFTYFLNTFKAFVADKVNAWGIKGNVFASSKMSPSTFLSAISPRFFSPQQGT